MCAGLSTQTNFFGESGKIMGEKAAVSASNVNEQQILSKYFLISAFPSTMMNFKIGKNWDAVLDFLDFLVFFFYVSVTAANFLIHFGRMPQEMICFLKGTTYIFQIFCLSCSGIHVTDLPDWRILDT